MRIRSTKPEFWRSARVASVDWDARLVLKGLESFVDDNGVGKDDLPLIVADVFPRDLSRNPPGTLRKVAEALNALSDAGLLWRYEADGNRLLYIAFWESIQRIEKPTRGRFPRPDGTMNFRDSIIGAPLPEPSRNPPGTLRPGTGEQGNRGTEEKDSSSPAAPATVRVPTGAFDTFWSAYPRKVGKDAARRAFDKAARRVGHDTITAGAYRFAADPNLPAKEFIPHPATWLNAGRWDDEPLPPRTDPRTGAPATAPTTSPWDRYAPRRGGGDGQ